MTGKTLGDFSILRCLGQGGMGQVYLAEQISLKRKVALKTLRPELAANETSLKRFRQEAEAIARVTHSNIVQVYVTREDNGIQYMALEYVEGLNLREYLAKKGPPELMLALSVMRQVAAALARAAEAGIVHRDIKPENILLTRKGEVKVADFGLSRCFSDDQPTPRLTQSGVTMGTPLYMSPEQVQGGPIDARTDIYSFGVTSYHMLTGEPPFKGVSALEVAWQHVQTQPKPLHAARPDLPPELCAIVHKMMAKNPDHRYQTCRDISRDLSRLKESLGAAAKGHTMPPLPAGIMTANLPPTVVSPPTAIFQEPSRFKRTWLRWATALLFLLAAGAGGAAVAWKINHAPPPLPNSGTPELPDISEKERLLRIAAETHPKPDGPMQLREGLIARFNLGFHYLDEKRWKDSHEFFTSMVDNPFKIKEYRDFGQLGQAISLAYLDKPKESVALFLEFDKRSKEDFLPILGLMKYPQLGRQITLAVERDKNSLPDKDFPNQLERLLKPLPFPPLRPLGKDRLFPKATETPEK